MEPVLVKIFIRRFSNRIQRRQQECEIFETQMLIVTHPYLDSLELIERWVCSEKEQWENSWKTSSSCQKTVMTSHWSMSGLHIYLNGLATLNLYSLGDCPLACLPQIMDEYMQCRYQVLKKEAIQWSAGIFFISESWRRIRQEKRAMMYLPHGPPQRNRRKKSLLRLVKFGWFFRNCGELLSKTPARLPNHLFIIPFQRHIYKLLLYKVHGAHKFAGAVLALIVMTKSPFCLSASFKLTQIKQMFPRKCKIL